MKQPIPVPPDPESIYFDHNATTPCDGRVIEIVAHTMRSVLANPSSGHHAAGRRAAALVEDARRDVADLIGAQTDEILFTATATESCNLAIKGLAARCDAPGHLVTALSEHKAVTEPARRLELAGWRVTWLRPDRFGMIHAEQVEEAIGPQTRLVSIMAANNVVGTINPIARIGQVCRRHDVPLHCDATQAAGKIPIDVEEWQVDLLSFSAHKFHGPGGVAALYARRRPGRVRLDPLIDGGGQERGLRSGTLHVAGIAGFGAACRIAREEMASDAQRTSALCQRLLGALQAGLGPLTLVRNGHPHACLPTTLNVSIDGVEAEALARAMPGVAFSVGSACTSGTSDPHHVLRAMGLTEQEAAGAIRLSAGRFTTADEIDRAAALLVDGVRRLRAASSGAASACCPDGSCCG